MNGITTQPPEGEGGKRVIFQPIHQHLTTGLNMVPYIDRRIKMDISKDIKPITYLKSRASDLLKQINQTHRPVVITQNGEPKAILQDPESYQGMRNAIGILKLVSQGEKDIKNGKSKSQEEVFQSIENILKARMR